MNVENLRRDFPLLAKRNLIYFDSACTTLKPAGVIEAVSDYYSRYSGCAGRSPHVLGRETDAAVEGARKKVASFIGARENEVVWTKNTTEAINLVARSMRFNEGDVVLTTNMEHHSAMLPFQLLADNKRISLEFVTADKEGLVDAKRFEEKISEKTKLVVLHHTTNSLGTSSPFREVTKLAHENGSLVLIDAAQGAPHFDINFRREDFDFLAFSGHKMLGPTGIGCLVGKQDLLKEMQLFMVGGETIKDVTLDMTVYAEPPSKFEAGTQHNAGIIGLGAAVDYLKKTGMHSIESHERKLSKALIEGVAGVDKVTLYGPRDASKRLAVASFNVGKLSPQEVAVMFDEQKICLRAGFLCAQPAMEHLGAKQGAARASLYLYNTEEEIGVFLEALKKIAKLA
jgi:cysteine desulfurase/selenocysteine lyase